MNRYQNGLAIKVFIMPVFHLEMEPRKHGRVDHQDPNNQEDTSKDGGQNIPQAKPAKSD